MPVDIAFITVNYNTLDLVTKLASFFQHLKVPFTFSFTVVDNHSTDGSQEFLASCPDLQYIQAGKNIGYGPAINRGVAATESKYICVMNTDVIATPQALASLWQFLEESKGVGVCAPRITYADGRDQGMIFHASLFAHYAEWYAKIIANRLKSQIAHATEPVRVQGVMGAFFLIRRSIVPPPALFDEDFFFFYEDSALAHSMSRQGVACFILPNVSIIHIGGKSRSESSVSLFYNSKYLYLTKFYGGFHAKSVRFFDRFRVFRKWLLYSGLRLFTRSERIQSKQVHYRIALKTLRGLGSD